MKFFTLNTNLACLRLLAFLEGMSFLMLLAIGMPLKYLLEMPTPNLYIGMAHGVLFIAYCLYVVLVKFQVNWNLKTTFWALFASLVPFGTFVVDHRIFKPLAIQLNSKSTSK